MGGKGKVKLLEKKLFNNIKLMTNGENASIVNSQLFFGGMKKDIFVDMSSSYLLGRISDKQPLDQLGFYVKHKGYPIKIDLNHDKVYEDGGKLIVEK
ncbi:MAG TPA: hypothetical protein PK357_03660 [Candidatus Pacearchaeota archaeon]|nr:hypothetical protein [Candidatus Pacearchaeota archaeon]